LKVLGIHDGHNSTVALMDNGKITAAISEERLRRIKNWTGWPEKSIEWVLKYTNTKPEEIDLIAFPTLTIPLTAEQLKLTEERAIFRKIVAQLSSTFPLVFGSEKIIPLYQRIRRRNLSGIRKKLEALGIDAPIVQVEHHMGHAAAVLLSGFEDSLVFTLDGSGDGYSGSVSLWDGSCLKRLQVISAFHSIGEIYTRVTQYLGMKPLEHEYKVMGLAPYAPPKLQKIGDEIFSKLIGFDDGKIVNKSGKWGISFYNYLKKVLPGVRFDAIAYGLQKNVERTVVEWVRYWMNKTGVRRIVLSGGVFMNVKLNMLLSEIADDIFIFPSCGDESLALTSAAYVYWKESKKLPEKIGPIYFGPDFKVDREKFEDVGLNIEKVTNPEKVAAELVAGGNVVARFKGRMEWGARALGNRSILANASELKVVGKINRTIKKRDFWMPFAPSVLDQHMNLYFKNARFAPYMIMAFRARERAKTDIIAALHQADFTGRPQTVAKDWNKDYYNLLKYYEELTGFGGLLNTSFNLHGEPIVCSPNDAIHTMINSDLQYMVIENYLVTKV